MEAVIRLEQVVKFYPPNRWAINGISMSLGKGEFMAICGGPGSGKSTLTRLIAGIEKPSEGNLFVLEQSMHTISENEAADFRNKQIGFLPRDPAFLSSLTVMENVSLPLAIRGMKEMERTNKTREWLKMLGLSEQLHVLPKRLSAYDRQRVGLARAMAAGPQLLLADEPTGDLNQKESNQLLELLQELTQKEEIPLLLFTQDIKISRHAQRILTLADGKLQGD